MKSLFVNLSKIGLLLLAFSSAAFAADSVDTTLDTGSAGTITGTGTTTTTTTTTTTGTD
ncbi:hypothetical protein [Ketobacter nezhaii]|uniref:hypothetical protein n=1 Tax=Ketobacter sp. MCCC 1A13808 TaxID=2602738 RepID=UPI0012EB6F9A|nr:hypothetical protein [Ketobacter sp. MCCC 1A13808]